MSNDKSKAARLAEWCDSAATTGDMGRKPDPKTLYRQVAAELRRLDAVNRELLEALRNFVDGCSLSVDAGAVARAAIAKATDV